MKATIKYEGNIWLIDLEDMVDNPEKIQIKIIDPDGTQRSATKEDGNLMDVLNMGMVIDNDPKFT